MSEHRASLRWQLSDDEFARGKFSRAHTWSFDGGVTVPASATPAVVREPYSDPHAVDPEEAFVAALSSCHMMTFLHLASKGGFVVTHYEDDAVGVLEKSGQGSYWMSQVTLRPRVTYREGSAPSPEQEADLHGRAHETCFIANSVKSAVRIEPRVDADATALPSSASA
jgi:organic hydroperoxide reductase OsmC/OhrA